MTLSEMFRQRTREPIWEEDMSKADAVRITPVAPPQIVEGVYTEDQVGRAVAMMHRVGPWPLILAQHFASAEEVAATLTGASPGAAISFDDFLTAQFRGYIAMHGACLYPDLEDLWLNSVLLTRARDYWGAKYAAPEQMLFNLQGPSECFDPGHLDATEYRGITKKGAPVWLLNTMSKSGLFTRWIKKKTQIIMWFYKGAIGGGFTYWPNGLDRQPDRLASPLWNRGVVVQSEMMYHRGEANGPLELRKPKGLAFSSVMGADPGSADAWRITTDGATIQTIPSAEVRFLLHWSANVYMDMADLKRDMEHTDDLSVEQVADAFLKDLRARGVSVSTPSDPLHDRDFIATLTKSYDPGAPLIYPQDAPGPFSKAA